MSLPIPWKTKDTAVTKPNDAAITRVVDDNEVVVIQRTRPLIQAKPKPISINGTTHRLDYAQLIRMIKHITQTIGEHKNQEGPNADYYIVGLRKARAEMVSDLEHYFGIHWQVGEDGSSIFWV